jgi:tRNA-guanine family transglycosylase
MVQALHFSSYKLSQGAWDDWFYPTNNKNRLKSELEMVFGPQRSIFVDSGGFQILNSDKIDLSKWQIKIAPEDIFHLQMRYSPQCIASLDSPLSPNFVQPEVQKLMKYSIDNAVWLTENISTAEHAPVPYLVVHGRNPEEVKTYLSVFEKSVRKQWFKDEEYGIALGSQVPISSNPQMVLDNCVEALHWMNTKCSTTTPFHIFGVGENIIGNLISQPDCDRPISYDNSTYVQNAFRGKIYDATKKRYRPFNPFDMPKCGCVACQKLQLFGSEFVSNLLAKRAYNPSCAGTEKVNRSDIFGLIGLHNLQSWETRLVNVPLIKNMNNNGAVAERKQTPICKEYSFPLAAFEPLSPNLLLLPCSKSRPYGDSPSHKRIKSYLAKEGYEESVNYDRITLSGLYGPVHWRHEKYPAILQYDFTLGTDVSKEHIQYLQMRTAMVLNVISKKYEGKVAYIKSKRYQNAFESVLTRYDVPLMDEMSDLRGVFDFAISSDVSAIG